MQCLARIYAGRQRRFELIDYRFENCRTVLDREKLV
jgi:hypothetical protein